MAYGVNIPTEVGYIYSKKVRASDSEAKSGADDHCDGIPNLKTVIWENANGKLTQEQIDAPRGGIADIIIKKKVKRDRLNGDKLLPFSGDGSVPYLSLSWAHTWLLHAARAKRFSDDGIGCDRKNALDYIGISHRPKGTKEWIEGPPPTKKDNAEDRNRIVDDSGTGTSHPHGTRYKPEMIRYHNVGISRTTGIEYTTTVIEALGVEHKETTR